MIYSIDLDYWKKAKSFSINQAAMLLAGKNAPKDNSDITGEDQSEDFTKIQQELCLAVTNSTIEASRLSTLTFEEEIDGRTIRYDEIDPSRTIIDRDSLTIWASDQGYSPKFLSTDSAEIEKLIEASKGKPEEVFIFKEIPGGLWLIRVKNKEKKVRRYRGYYYIKHLFANPGKKIPVLALVNLVNPKDSDISQPHLSRVDKDNISGEVESKVIDDKARADYEKIREDLEVELEQLIASGADNERLKLLEHDLEKLNTVLSEAQTPDGKVRFFSGNTEKARKSVYKSITDARNKLEKLEWKELDEHLDRILTGSSCVYDYHSEITWITS